MKQPKTLNSTRADGQISANVPMYFNRIVPYFGNPGWMDGDRWRVFVRNQPIAMICRETLISNIVSLNFQILPRDSDQREELKKEIDYYTKGFEYQFGPEYSTHIEWMMQDLLDLPFGTACEVIREGDDPKGKVLELVLIDGATLFPTPDRQYPVGQQVASADTFIPVYFPNYAINRSYLTARPEFLRTGWGMCPPEKIYLAMEMLYRGDQYYANLLLDTPQAGLLDLGDMEKETAKTWVQEFRNLLQGIDAFKIPVLYEHTTQTKFIPFGTPPTEIMYDKIALKQAAIVAAGYGMSLSDIGIASTSESGDTLAGTIRQERRTRRTGMAMVKHKVTAYFNRLLPEYLEFKLVDYDDELNLAMGRSRLANSQAMAAYIERGIFSPTECRQQIIADGLFSIPVPDDPPADAVPTANPLGLQESRLKTIGQPVAPSMGGHGDISGNTVNKSEVEKLLSPNFTVMKNLMEKKLSGIVSQVNEARIKKLVRIASKKVFPQVLRSVETLDDETLASMCVYYSEYAFNDTIDPDTDVVMRSITDIDKELQKALDDEPDWWKAFELASIALITDIFKQEFAYGLRDSTNQVLFSAYEDGLMPFPDVQRDFSLQNESYLRKMELASERMIDNVNKGTAFYLKRATIAVARDVLSTPEYATLIRNGMTIESILADTNFVSTVTNKVQSEISEIMRRRADVISAFELSRINNMAVLENYKKMGLTKKMWKNLGQQPCPVCVRNQSQGYVPLDFEYESVFPGEMVHTPPAHPVVEYCALVFDRTELSDIIQKGKFSVWHGE